MLRPFASFGSFARALMIVGMSVSVGCSLILDLHEGIPRGTGGSGASSSTGGSGGEACDPKEKCPVPATACIEATCDGEGVCGTKNAPAGTVCADGAGSVCDGMGTCGSCGDPATDCPVTGSECVVAICTGGACGTMLVADGTATGTGQATGDCQQQVCDGMGTTKIVVDGADPADDGNACTTDTCNGTMNVHAPVSAGASCAQGGGKVCGSGGKAGTCVGCLANTDCTDGTNTHCDTLNDNFVCVPATCNNGSKDGNETGIDCGGPLCGKCGNTQPCVVPTDCVSNLCSGGVCTGCAGDGDCPPAEFCNGSACSPDKAAGAMCTLPSQCVSGFCFDGFCCDAVCSGVCQACSGAKKGSGADGACGNIAANIDPDNECAGAGSCNGAGACQLALGTACSTGAQCAGGHCVDSVCCDTACSGLCVACSAAKKSQGVDGTCDSVSANTDPDNECSASYCDGTGLCQLSLGDSCGSNEQCPGALNCIDGYCCDSDCSGTCMSCDGSKTFGGNGTCSEINSGTDPDNECFGFDSCFSGFCQ